MTSILFNKTKFIKITLIICISASEVFRYFVLVLPRYESLLEWFRKSG